MTFIILFEDAADADTDIRKTHMNRHLEFLESHASVIKAAGPLGGENRNGADGLWIVETEHRHDVERLIQQDPFWPTGLRKSYRILKWTQVFADGRRLISRG